MAHRMACRCMGTCHLACDLPRAFCVGRNVGHLPVGDAMNLREAAQQALWALENVRKYDKEDLYGLDDDITALRTALSEPEQEPEQNTVTCVCGAVWEGNLMVHAPRQRKPLTEPELHKINPTWPAPGQHWDYEDVLEFVRAIERAHGIGGEA